MKIVLLLGIVVLAVVCFLYFRGPSGAQIEETAGLFAGAYCETGILENFRSLSDSDRQQTAKVMMTWGTTFSEHLKKHGATQDQIEVMRKLAKQEDQKDLVRLISAISARMTVGCPARKSNDQNLAIVTGVLLGTVRSTTMYGAIGK